MSPEICAETVVTTTPESVTTTQAITTQEITTQEITTTKSQSTVLMEKMLWLYTAIFTSICIRVLGATAFAISEVLHRIQKRRHRKSA
jgi:hypothetical protein